VPETLLVGQPVAVKLLLAGNYEALTTSHCYING